VGAAHRARLGESGQGLKLDIAIKAGVWEVGPVDPSVTEHIPGMLMRGLKAVGSRDAASVLFKRLGYNYVTQSQPPAPYLSPDWGTLRSYQRDGVARLRQMLSGEGGAILADDMGLGKTAQTIATWDALKRPWPLMVCAPASVRRTWLREFNRWVPGVPVLLADTSKKLTLAGPHTPVVVTSYELAAKSTPAAFSPAMLVFDEAHLLRGRQAQRSQALFELARVASYRLALTGTPIWSRPRDWWMLLKILYGYRFGTADQFDYAYCAAFVNQWGGKENAGISRPEELKQRIAHVMLRRLKEDVATEIPPLTRLVKWVPGTKEAKRASEAAVLGNLHVSDALEATLLAKIPVAVEAMREAGISVVFTWRKVDAYKLAEDFTADTGEPCEVITGDITHKERQAIVDRCVAKRTSLVATIDSTGTGVDGLQNISSNGIFHALDYTPIKLAQAEARLHRLNSTKPVTWTYIAMEDTVDEAVVETVVEKLDQWRQLMGEDSTAGIGTGLQNNAAASEEAALNAILEAMKDE